MQNRPMLPWQVMQRTSVDRNFVKGYKPCESGRIQGKVDTLKQLLLEVGWVCIRC